MARVEIRIKSRKDGIDHKIARKMSNNDVDRLLAALVATYPADPDNPADATTQALNEWASRVFAGSQDLVNKHEEEEAVWVAKALITKIAMDVPEDDEDGDD